MLNLLKPKKLTTAMALSAALLLQAPAWAQSPAELAPADTKFFFHVNEPGDWVSELTEGPLGQKWITMIEEGEGTGDLLAALDMNFDQFMDAYLGKDVVILGQGKAADGSDLPGVIFTKVSAADRATAIDSLALKLQGDIAGNPVYTGEDGNGYIVMMDEWVAMADLAGYDYLKSIVSQPANAPKLANTELYAKWTKELPADRSLTLLDFGRAETLHAIGVVRQGKGMDATYLGKSPEFDELMAMLGETSVAEFGPLPAETIAAITFNIEPTGPAKASMQYLNMFIGGKSFVDDVLPKLDPPTVLFMGAVDGDTVDPNVDVQVPVVGMAFKMNDASVATDMNMMFDSVVMMLNVGVMNFEAGLIPQSVGAYGGSDYKVAGLGKPIAQGLEFPELAPIQLVYGVVGDYYVVCTQEQFFKKCVDANKGDKAFRIEVEGKPHRLAETPVLAMNAEPDRFGSLMLSWINLLDKKGLPEAITGGADIPLETEQAKDVVRMLQQYSLVKMQVWSGEDGLVIGRAQLTAPQ